VYRDRVPPLAPHVAALIAYYQGNHAVKLRLRSSLGEDEDFPVDFFFRAGDAFLPFERYALELASGSVLDLGAGVGAHALALQARGISVVALEIDTRLAHLQRARGVRHGVCADFRYWSGSKFDTVLMLMNGLGPVGTLEGLARFLHHAPRFLAPGGQLLVDAAEAVPEPVSAIANARAPALPPWPPPGDYRGQAWIELSFDGRVGRPFRELYVDLETLVRTATDAGWHAGIAFEGERGSYLARLTRG